MVFKFTGLLNELMFKAKAGRCFKKVKREQMFLDMPRFYLAVTKCEELAELSSGWKTAVLLFHLSHATVDFDDHIVIRFLRWLRSS